MQQATVTLIVACLGISGTLSGIVIGHFLTRTWQRRQWVMDQRHAEFKELVEALDESMRAQRTQLLEAQACTPEEQRDIYRRQGRFLRTIRTRIFTASDVRRLKLEERWRHMVKDFKEHDDRGVFGNECDTLAEELVTLAVGKRVREK